MAKYVPNEFVQEYHGKRCQHSKQIFAKRYNTLYTITVCNPNTECTATQLAHREKFAAVRALVGALTVAEKTKAKAYFKNNSKLNGKQYYDLNGYLTAVAMSDAVENNGTWSSAKLNAIVA